ncbi:response regulator [Reyranella sp.]|uniref:response regulator n=1 Tax=Reyranella sp. TaxID=1929291 RepID=UPI003783547C
MASDLLDETPRSLAGESEVRRLMQGADWSATSLGPPETWPSSLRAVIRVMLTSRFAMWMAWGTDLTFLCNDAYLPTVGIKRDWVIGSRSDKVWAEIWSDIGPRIEHVLATGEATWDEELKLYLERSGFSEETFHTFSYSPLADDIGSTTGMLCVVAEVTEKVIGERQLATLRDLGVRLSAASTRVEVMQSLEACLHANPHDLPFALAFLTPRGAGEATLSAVHGLDLEKATQMQHLFPMIKGRHHDASQSLAVHLPPGCLGEFPLLHWQQPPSRAVMTSMASAEDDGAPVGLFVAGINPHRQLDDGYRGFIELLTAQLAAAVARADEYERAAARAEALAEIDRAKTTFFSNVSHEFRTPLTLMLGPLEEAMMHDLPPQQHERIEIAHRNAMRLLRLVNTLLDFARIEARRFKSNFQPTDLAALTADLASSFRSATTRAGLRLVVDTPKLSQPVRVDRDMWEKIVLNLLSNAFKFTFDGEIVVRLSDIPEGVRLTVRDTGTGIPASELPKLFDRFHRVEGASGRSYEGSGIGLALVQELVKQHGGAIEVESELDHGSTFSVILPRTGDSAEGADGTVPDRPTAHQAQSFVEEALRWLSGDESTDGASVTDQRVEGSAANRGRILIADDNPDLRSYIAKLLQGQGYQVKAVANGEEALVALRRDRPDLVVTDVMMPKLDGFGLLHAVRRDPGLSDLPVLMLSARAGEEAKVEGLDAGANDYLTKPFAARELVARVAVNIALASARREAARSEEQLRGVLAGMGEGFVLLDRSLRIVELNAAALAMETRSREELVGRLHNDVAPNADPQIEKLYRQAFDEQVSVAHEHHYTWPDERSAWLEMRAHPVGDHLAVFYRDVTLRRAADDALRDLNATLEQRVAERTRELIRVEESLRQAQKMEAMGQLTGGVAHDFNNLLTPIISVLDLLQRKGVGGERERRLIGGAAQSAERAKTLVQRLLAFARRQPLQVAGIDVAKLVAGMAQLVASVTGPQIKVVVDVPDGLPSANADRNQLEMAVLNLSVNARDAMPEGGVLRISASAQAVTEGHKENLKPGQYIKLSVSDTGSGMDEATLARAVEPFFSTKGVGKGTGLGLSMVHGLASQLGGALVINSKLGLGTNVELWLAESADLPEEIAPVPASVPLASIQKALLVEDDENVRLSAADMLVDLGYEVIGVETAEQALRVIDQGRKLDLIVTDHLMPGMSGLELARRVRALDARIPVLIVSGYAQGEGIELEFARLTKPFRKDDLAASLARLKDSRSRSLSR